MNFVVVQIGTKIRPFHYTAPTLAGARHIANTRSRDFWGAFSIYSTANENEVECWCDGKRFLSFATANGDRKTGCCFLNRHKVVAAAVHEAVL